MEIFSKTKKLLAMDPPKIAASLRCRTDVPLLKKGPMDKKNAPLEKGGVFCFRLATVLILSEVSQTYFFRETAPAATRDTTARAAAMPTTSLAPVSGLSVSGVVSPSAAAAETRALSEKT